MRFTTFAFAAATAFASFGAADITAKGVVSSIEEITDLSSDTNDVLKDVNTGSIFTAVPKVITGLTKIVTTGVKDVTMLTTSGSPDIPKSGQEEICEAFTGFVKVHQNLLKTIIGKKGLLSNTPFTAPVGFALRGIEGVVDKLAFSIIGLVPTCASTAQKDANALKGTIEDAIKEYTPALPKIPGLPFRA